MKRLLPWFLFLALAGVLSAAGPDDDYIRIYNLIQQGDSFDQKGERAQAAEAYIQASKALQKLHISNPNWNEAAVRFRLDYLAEKLQGLSRPGPAEAKPGSGTRGPAATVAAAEMQQELEQLRMAVQRLTDKKNLLEAQLKEALSTAPPPIDPREFARAQEQAASLQKEVELLKVSLGQEKARTATVQKNIEEWSQKNPSTADLKRVREVEQERDALKARLDKAEKLAAQMKAAAEKPVRNARAEERLADLEAANAALQVALKQEQRKVEKLVLLETTVPEGESNRLQQLQKERDELQKKLDGATRQIEELKARLKTSARPPSSAIRRTVLAVPPVSVGGGEINLQVEAVTPEKKKRPELPPGAGPLVAEAERAVAARRFEDAEKKYLEVLRQDENNIYMLGNVAAVQWEMNKLEEAEKNVRKAMGLDPEDAFALRMMGMIRFRQNKFDEAVELLKRSAKIDGQSAETQNYLGIALSQKGESVPAEAALRKALQLQPAYASAHFNLALIYSSQKPAFPDLARWHYRRAKSLGHASDKTLEEALAEK